MDTIVHLLIAVSNWIYLALNGLSGRSWLLDTLISLPIDNPLVKAGPVGAAFVYAWHSGRNETETQKRRSVLLVTIASLFLVLAVTKTLGGQTFLPRPFIQSQQAWHLDHGALVETAKLPYRSPLAGESKDRYEALARGEVVQNDLGSFPSDHAGFFFALALGIFLACRRAGAVALAWTFFAILLPRIITGMHSPLDIAAGAGIGGAILLALQWLARGRWAQRALAPVCEWTQRHGAIAAALLFLFAFEATNALENARNLAGVAKDVAGGVLGI